MTDMGWNRCDYCGRFIAYADYDAGRAGVDEIYPDSFCTVETWERYHVSCLERSYQLKPAANTLPGDVPVEVETTEGTASRGTGFPAVEQAAMPESGPVPPAGRE
jgi:hypothetical protein